MFTFLCNHGLDSYRLNAVESAKKFCARKFNGFNFFKNFLHIKILENLIMSEAPSLFANVNLGGKKKSRKFLKKIILK